MKLYHGQYILPALVLFLGAATAPIWRGAASPGPGFRSPPNPNGERCIEPKGFMRAEHMRMIVRWRDGVVREGNRIYVATDGRHWEKSLKTCVACHGHADARGKSTTAAAACGECHGYVNAKLDCWGCHHESAAPAPGIVRARIRPLDGSTTQVGAGTPPASAKEDL
jgi:hypothetical protein